MIYLLRHGLDDETYIGGWSDVSLIDEGINQVSEIANKIKANESIHIEKVIASNVKRTIETAEIVTSILGLKEFETTHILREQSKGRLNGMLKSDSERLYPEYFGPALTPETIYPDGESLKDLYIRIRDNLSYLSDLSDNTLLITHRGVINMLYYILNELPLDMDKKKFDVTHASLHEFDKKNKSIRKVM